MPKILVTGGAGFIGSHVVDRFLLAGYEVVCIDNLSAGKRANLAAGVELHVADVQSPEAFALVRSGGFDAIAHLAAQVDVRKSVTNPLDDLRTNTAGTVNLLEAVRSLPNERRPRVVFASTGGALYGDATQFPTAEDAPTNPDAPYGIDKLSAELYLAYYSRIWEFQTVVLRFGNVYGPRQDSNGEGGVIAIFAQRLLQSKPLIVYGDGTQTRDYVYVGDVATAFLSAVERRLSPAGSLAARAYNVGTAVETSVNELIAVLAATAGRDPIVEHAPHRPGEIKRSVLDPRKARQQLHWRAVCSLADGVATTYSWVASTMPRSESARDTVAGDSR